MAVRLGLDISLAGSQRKLRGFNVNCILGE
jgi:hypothetical protein